MARSFSLRTGVALALSSFLLVSGCSDSGSPAAESTVSGSASASAEPVSHVKSFSPYKDYSGLESSVAEFFSYGCSHCQAFAPLIDGWSEKEGISVEYLPVVWSEETALQARIHYLLKEREDFKTQHYALFEQVAALGNQGTPEERQAALMGWLTSLGYEAQELSAKLFSPEMDTALNRIQKLGLYFQVRSTPTLVVAGRDKVLNDNLKSYEHLLEVATEQFRLHQ